MPKFTENFNVHKRDEKYRIADKFGIYCTPLEISNRIGFDVDKFCNLMRIVYGATIENQYERLGGIIYFKKEKNAKRAVEYINGAEVAYRLISNAGNF